MISPSQKSQSPLQWVRANLFNGWFNSLLTLVCGWALISGAINILRWITTQAQWAVVSSNIRLFLVGRYPVQQVWRVWLAFAIALSLLGFWSWAHFRAKRQPSLSNRLTLLPFAFPLAAGLIFWLIQGRFGLPNVSTSLWGGLLLTLIVALTSIMLAFPLGVLLALGRQSTLPVLKSFCTLYIEIIRGLPLIGILFIAQAMLPLVLPGQPTIDRVARAIAGLVFFNAAYLAENIRGGLQSIPRGQTEAAKALGFNTPLTLMLVILPQALRIATPAIVGQFISLFKDTSLLALFALLELTGIARSILAQPNFLGRYAEVYLFVGLIYWAFCYTMSLVSRRLEAKR